MLQNKILKTNLLQVVTRLTSAVSQIWDIVKAIGKSYLIDLNLLEKQRVAP